MKELYEIEKEFLGKYRKGNLSKDEINMMHAIIAGLNSKDPSTQVGACIVDKDNNILSLGCNNNPKGWNKNDFPWGNDTKLGEENTKYPYIIHAEVNTIKNYKGLTKDLEGATMYVTLFPCLPCAREIVTSGIKKLIYIDARDNVPEYKMARILLNKCGVECIKFDELKEKELKGIDINLNTNNVKELIKIKNK